MEKEYSFWVLFTIRPGEAILRSIDVYKYMDYADLGPEGDIFAIFKSGNFAPLPAIKRVRSRLCQYFWFYGILL